MLKRSMNGQNDNLALDQYLRPFFNRKEKRKEKKKKKKIKKKRKPHNSWTFQEDNVPVISIKNDCY